MQSSLGALDCSYNGQTPAPPCALFDALNAGSTSPLATGCIHVVDASHVISAFDTCSTVVGPGRQCIKQRDANAWRSWKVGCPSTLPLLKRNPNGGATTIICCSLSRTYSSLQVPPDTNIKVTELCWINYGAVIATALLFQGCTREILPQERNCRMLAYLDRTGLDVLLALVVGVGCRSSSA